MQIQKAASLMKKIFILQCPHWLEFEEACMAKVSSLSRNDSMAPSCAFYVLLDFVQP